MQSLRSHWPEYLMEAWGLGMFMISACFFTVLLYHPDSIVYQTIPDALVRGSLTGIAMGLTAITLILSRWGKRSGAHLNPAFTWTFFRLKKVSIWDAMFYSVAQFTGGLLGVGFSGIIIESHLSHASVRYAVTLPGSNGIATAFLAELFISFFLMFTVLMVSNHARFSRYTPFFAGVLIATYITFEAPLSGMSMNPARTFASAYHAGEWTGLWIYFIAPPLGMLMAAELYLRARGVQRVFCAKYHHDNNARCIFRCNFGKLLKADNHEWKEIKLEEKSLC